MSERWIKASEIGEYVYCRRSWWLRRMHAVPSMNAARMQAGTQYHERHGRLLETSAWLRRLAYAAIFFAMALLVYQILSG